MCPSVVKVPARLSAAYLLWTKIIFVFFLSFIFHYSVCDVHSCQSKLSVIVLVLCTRRRAQIVARQWLYEHQKFRLIGRQFSMASFLRLRRINIQICHSHWTVYALNARNGNWYSFVFWIPFLSSSANPAADTQHRMNVAHVTDEERKKNNISIQAIHATGRLSRLSFCGAHNSPCKLPATSYEYLYLLLAVAASFIYEFIFNGK